MKLTAKTFATVRLDAGKTDQIFFDDEIPGFGLRVRAGGSRNWVFQYSLGEKQRRMSLGRATAESFKSSKGKDGTPNLGIRDRVMQMSLDVKHGKDPQGEKVESRSRASDTFQIVAAEYLKAKKAETRPGTYQETERHILKHARPLNGLQVAKIKRRDVATLLGTIRENSGPVAANRVRSTLSDFFGWTIGEGIAESNPVIGTNKTEETSRERVLKDFELRLIWRHAGDDDHGTILKLMMLTGQRADEVANLGRAEIGRIEVPKKRGEDGAPDLPAYEIDAIDLPGERTKNKRPHLVPLAAKAKELLDAKPVRANGDGTPREFVFGIGQGGFSGWSRCKERLDERIEKDLGRPLEHWRPHDLRRTMSTKMNDELDVLPHVVEAILNHVSSTQSGKRGVAGTYNKALYLRERVVALRRWADHLSSIVNNVIPMERSVAQS
ncbi:integrase [Bradyrhizobium japonicum]|nr:MULTISPECIES: tyrosine-type recombinase/integrase [Bradyrhizobium]MBR0882407.1 tyrosine-type recombinase/integrase [Bradyrhizobium liaoningense]MBR0945546.1 tyrosine-type recombinase/integrase [Bradyrhizobium liaoningense]MBR1032261.1 tyrosine-type recombinase/integrase [Bradyrhizobium liaoningense]MBR1070836.1 tyrosine-type recombinase/integrase [Bradyrhizobium liaoningense]MCP1779924.1 integrase [Bradyrhizobium japonicum]